MLLLACKCLCLTFIFRKWECFITEVESRDFISCGCKTFESTNRCTSRFFVPPLGPQVRADVYLVGKETLLDCGPLRTGLISCSALLSHFNTLEKRCTCSACKHLHVLPEAHAWNTSCVVITLIENSFLTTLFLATHWNRLKVPHVKASRVIKLFARCSHGGLATVLHLSSSVEDEVLKGPCSLLSPRWLLWFHGPKLRLSRLISAASFQPRYLWFWMIMTSITNSSGWGQTWRKV